VNGFEEAPRADRGQDVFPLHLNVEELHRCR